MKHNARYLTTTKAFTILEIMTALVIFSGSMLAYLGYQGTVAKVLYDAQSRTLAGHIADDLVQAVDAMDHVEFNTLVSSIAMDSIQTDNSVAQYITSLDKAGTSIQQTTGPFSTHGIPIAGDSASTLTPFFYRHIRINTYGAETNTGGLTIEQLWFYYYHVEVIVGWPKASDTTGTTCTDVTNSHCDRISIHFMKGVK